MPDPRKLKDEAAKALEKGKHKRAGELYVEIAGVEKDEPLWPHRAGEAFKRVGMKAEASAQLSTAAELYAKQGFLLKAISVAKMILEVDPARTETQAMLAALYARRDGNLAPAAPRPAAVPLREPIARGSDGEIDIALEAPPPSPSGRTSPHALLVGDASPENEPLSLGGALFAPAPPAPRREPALPMLDDAPGFSSPGRPSLDLASPSFGGFGGASPDVPLLSPLEALQPHAGFDEVTITTVEQPRERPPAPAPTAEEDFSDLSFEPPSPPRAPVALEPLPILTSAPARNDEPAPPSLELELAPLDPPAPPPLAVAVEKSPLAVTVEKSPGPISVEKSPGPISVESAPGPSPIAVEQPSIPPVTPAARPAPPPAARPPLPTAIPVAGPPVEAPPRTAPRPPPLPPRVPAPVAKAPPPKAPPPLPSSVRPGVSKAPPPPPALDAARRAPAPPAAPSPPPVRPSPSPISPSPSPISPSLSPAPSPAPAEPRLDRSDAPVPPTFDAASSVSLSAAELAPEDFGALLDDATDFSIAVERPRGALAMRGGAGPAAPVAAPPAPAPVAAPASPPTRPSSPSIDTLALKHSLPGARISQSFTVPAFLIQLEDDPARPAPPAPAGSRLPNIPLFSSLDEPRLGRLIERSRILRLTPDTVVVRHGEAGESLYVVVQGQVKVEFDKAGRPPVLLGEGEFFGELALMSDRPRLATVRTVGDTELLEISREVIWELIESAPDVLRVLLRFFRDRLIDRLIHTSPLFESFSPPESQALAARFQFLELNQGATLVREGERAEGLFVMLCGECEVFSRARGPIALLGPGELTGEMSLLAHGKAMATVRARSRVWVLALPRETFQEVILTHPQVLEYINDIAEARRAQSPVSLV